MADVTETTTIAVRIPSDLADRLEELAAENERTLSGEVRVALRAHVEQAERQAA